MNEHKKQYSTETNIFGDTAHIYSDGVHTGSSWGSQELADKAYQEAKHEDLDHVNHNIDPDKWDAGFWNKSGKKVDR